MKKEAGENCIMSDFIIFTPLCISEENQFLAQQMDNVQHIILTHERALHKYQTPAFTIFSFQEQNYTEHVEFCV
jgi:uncharacterized protein involved in tolerance to divalent cations